ncbi:MAG: GGDEF domain-containing protein [Lachnospiraceae bacterium]|nr:GGDEF domain-containing protein [Lachnospiraceae bacterium]
MAKSREKASLGKILYIVLLLLCISGRRLVCVGAEGNFSQNRVLFISSYSYAWDTVQIQIEGIRDELGSNVVLDFEFMDTKRVDDEESLRLFHDGLAYRLSKVEPYDAVILGDDAALKFALEYREELFQDIPLVFEGINSLELAQNAVKEPMVSGVIETLSVERNIQLGLKINPTAKKVVAIVDDTLTGEAVRQNIYQYIETFPGMEFSEINSSKLSSVQLKLALRNVSEDSILIYVTMTEDADGKNYRSMEAIRLISDNASVPVLRMVEGGVGEGLLGGNMVSMYQSGQLAAQLARQMIAGDTDRMGQLLDSPTMYCVDANIMEKYHIRLSVLPEGTVIVNEKESFFEKNREVLVPGIILVGALMVIIGWVAFDNYRRRKLMQQLKETGKILESASQHDFLTGIPNRSKFMADLKEQIDSKKPCTIMMIDIDDFKSINDTMGHTAGDEALRQVADRLKEMGTDLLTPYRFAGDEFILILKSNNSKIVQKTAYQCRQIFMKPFRLIGKDAKVCGSIGIASYPEDTEDMEQLVIYADDAMYHVKKSGKNDFAFYRTREQE